MKKSGALLLVGWGILSGISAANAQSKSDPSYSEHNYKHPNKALEMKEQKGGRPEVYLQEIKKDSNDGQQKNSLDAAANYKCISAEKSRTKRFAPSNQASAKPFHMETEVNNNYHQRFASPKKPASNVAKQKTRPSEVAEAKK